MIERHVSSLVNCPKIWSVFHPLSLARWSLWVRVSKLIGSSYEYKQKEWYELKLSKLKKERTRRLTREWYASVIKSVIVLIIGWWQIWCSQVSTYLFDYVFHLKNTAYKEIYQNLRLDNCWQINNLNYNYKTRKHHIGAISILGIHYTPTTNTILID